MTAHSLLFCPRCNATTAHARQAKYDSWGALSKQIERCVVCLTETNEGNGHEAPAADPPPVTQVLTDAEIGRAKFWRWRIEQGHVTEWPGDWWDTTPGVWS
jgi:hypothetical protein